MEHLTRTIEIAAYTLDELDGEARATARGNVLVAYVDLQQEAQSAAAAAALETWAPIGIDTDARGMLWQTFGQGSGAGPIAAPIVDAAAILRAAGIDGRSTEARAIREAVRDGRATIGTKDRTPWMTTLDIVDDWGRVSGKTAEAIEAVLRRANDETLERIEGALLSACSDENVTEIADEYEILFCEDGHIVVDGTQLRGERLLPCACVA
jgi:hypothetical protein